MLLHFKNVGTKKTKFFDIPYVIHIADLFKKGLCDKEDIKENKWMPETPNCI